MEGEQPTQTDALVVGLGLAGLAVVSALERRGRTFAAMHTDLPHAGSPAAAGLMLPITGPRWVLRPHYASLLAAARRQYGDRMVPVRMSRLLTEDDDVFLAKRRTDPAYSEVLGEWQSPHEDVLRDAFGRVSWTGHHVDVQALLADEHARLHASGQREEHRVDLDQVAFHDDGVVYRGRRFRWLIVCTGHHAMGAPPFEWLRYRAARGEWAELEPVDGLADGVYERRHWLHQQDGTSRIGSTYDWHDLEAGITTAGRDALVEAATSLVNAPVEVRAQVAGIRAPTMDRWPYVGAHPDGQRVALFAGLGGTGVLTAPLCADALVAHLFDGQALPAWLDLARREHDRTTP